MIKKAKHLLQTRQFEWAVLVTCFMLLVLFADLTYFNLILTPPLVFLIIALVGLVLFQVASETVTKFAMVLLLVCFFLTLLKAEAGAQLLGNLVYGLYFFAVVRAMISFLKEK